MIRKKSWLGIRAVEFTVCAGALAILGSAAAPQVNPELIASNQRAAVSTLHSIAAAQAQ